MPVVPLEPFAPLGALLPELFPTEIRLRANGICNMFGRGATVVSPFIVGALIASYKLPGVVWGFSQPIADNMEEAVSGVKGQLATKVYGDDLHVLEEKAVPPPEEFSKRAHVRSLDEYRKVHERALQDPDGFWSEQAKMLDWFEAPTQALESLRGKIWSKVAASEPEFREIERTFNLVSSHLIGGLHEVRIFADTDPGVISRRSASAFVAAARAAEVMHSAMKIKHFCLSVLVGAPLVAAGAATVSIAADPNETALLDLVDVP